MSFHEQTTDCSVSEKWAQQITVGAASLSLRSSSPQETLYCIRRPVATFSDFEIFRQESLTLAFTIYLVFR